MARFLVFLIATLLVLGATGCSRTESNPTPTPTPTTGGGMVPAPTQTVTATATDSWGMTPLHLAAEKGDLKKVKSLLSQGAKIDARGHEGRTPLFCATQRRQEEIVGFLLNQGADPNIADDFGETPLDLALGKGEMAEPNKKIGVLLRAKGAKTGRR